MSVLIVKKPYSPQEIAFIISYADRCIDVNSVYHETLYTEFNSRFPRSTSWENLRKKLHLLLKNHGTNKPSVQEFEERGTDCINIATLSEDIRSKIDSYRSEWDLPALGDEATVLESVAIESESTLSDEVASGKTAANKRLVAESMFTELTLASEGVQKRCEREIEYIADAARSPSSSDSSSCALATSKKRRAALLDDDYTPDPKPRKQARAPSARAPVTNRGVATLKVSGPTKKQQDRPTSYQAVREKQPTPHSRYEMESGQTSKITKGSLDEARAVSVMNLTGLPQDRKVAASGSSRQINGTEKTRKESNSDTTAQSQATAELSVPAASKKGGIIEISEDEAATVESSPKRQKTCKFTLEEINQKVDACLGLCRVIVANQQSPTEEFIEHIHQIIRTIKDTSGSMVENFAKDLDSQRALKVKYRSMVQNLVGFVDLTNGTEFPKVPPQKEVNQIWSAFYEHIVSTVGINHIEPTPTPEGAGYLSRCAEEIAHSRIPDSQLEACIASLSDYLISPHAQQTLISALFCRWVFSSPEPMLNDMHSAGMMQLYNAMMATEQHDHDGLAKVQQSDKVATKLLFEDPNFQAVEFNHRVSAFQTRFAQAKSRICAPSRIAARMKPEEFTADAVHFKQRLLLSPKEYRIHFVRPGTVFDARYMQAYDENNYAVSDVKAAGRKVALCMFPALVCREPDDMQVGAGVESALCKNKQFFPMFTEKVEDAVVDGLSKAVVLVLDE